MLRLSAVMAQNVVPFGGRRNFFTALQFRGGEILLYGMESRRTPSNCTIRFILVSMTDVLFVNGFVRKLANRIGCFEVKYPSLPILHVEYWKDVAVLPPSETRVLYFQSLRLAPLSFVIIHFVLSYPYLFIFPFNNNPY